MLMQRATACAGILGFLVLTLAGSVSAQERIYRTKAGNPVTVAVYQVCGPGGFPDVGVSGAARNGSISTRRGTRNVCARTNHPVMEMIYMPKSGFRGQDEAFLYGPYGLTERRRIVVE